MKSFSPSIQLALVKDFKNLKRRLTVKEKELKSLLINKRLIIYSNTKKMKPDVCAKIVHSLSKKINISINDSLTAIVFLILKGGTSQNAKNSLWVRTKNRKSVTLGNLRYLINQIQSGATVRNFARGYATPITQLILFYKKRGNLAKSLLKKFPEISTKTKLLAWCSDFNLKNPECPPKIKNVLKKMLKNKNLITLNINKTFNFHSNAIISSDYYHYDETQSWKRSRKSNSTSIFFNKNQLLFINPKVLDNYNQSDLNYDFSFIERIYKKRNDRNNKILKNRRKIKDINQKAKIDKYNNSKFNNEEVLKKNNQSFIPVRQQSVFSLFQTFGQFKRPLTLKQEIFLYHFFKKIKFKFVKYLIKQMELCTLKLKFHILLYSSNANNSSYRFLPFGYHSKLRLKKLVRLEKSFSLIKIQKLVKFKKFSLKLNNIFLPKLIKLVKNLKKRSKQKMKNLKKEFLYLGKISEMNSVYYYQLIFLISHLKKLIKRLKQQQEKAKRLLKVERQNKNNASYSLLTKFTSSQNNKKKLGNGMMLNASFSSSLNKQISQKSESKVSSTSQYSFYYNDFTAKLKKIDIEDECRKIRFLQYLKNIVKQHRSENLYFYLATIKESLFYVKEIDKKLKENASTLLGINLKSINFNISEEKFIKLKNKMKNHLKIFFYNLVKKSYLEKNYKELFIERIQRLKRMYLNNIKLIPRINIGFYWQKNYQTKASLVADSIVDSLEKRQPFRRVIKSAQENLNKSANVRGVKIQVAGRLNGAEIARTEWVRSGRVPLQTLKANIEYSYKTAKTIYGIIGVKVWIYKGTVKLKKKNRFPL
nr:ribosomal protein S3 [Elakatothrix viridis]